VRRMQPSTPQLMASLASRCANSLATLRNLLVSRRWMMAYCFAKQSSNVAWMSDEGQHGFQGALLCPVPECCLVALAQRESRHACTLARRCWSLQDHFSGAQGGSPPGRGPGPPQVGPRTPRPA
jgi:hypothetical protein